MPVVLSSPYPWSWPRRAWSRPERNSHVPLTPAEIAASVAQCHEWASPLSTSTPATRTAIPTGGDQTYARIVAAVRDAAPDVLINVSTSGRTWSELERRADCLALDGDLKPDLASLTLSSLNFLTGPSVNPPT